ncbi:MAG TPA: glycosyltransferase [Polyangiaceae bacterium]
MARAQRDRGCDVALLGLRGQGGPLLQRAKSSGIDVRTLGGHQTGKDLGLYRRIMRCLSELEPNVVHTHDPASLFYAAPVARARGAVVVHTKHGDDTVGCKRRLAARAAAALTHAVVAVSRDVATVARRGGEVGARKLLVIENGVDTERFSPGAVAIRRAVARERLGLPADAQVVGCVARFEAIKRHWLLLEAMLPTLSEKRWMLLVGDGSQREAITKQVSAHPSGRFVVLAGMMKDPLDALAAIDAFILTSSHEGLPLALLEGLSVGLPAIASAVGGIPGVVEHGVSGWLVELGEPGDSHRLRSAVDEVLCDSGLCKALGSAARQRVEEHFSVARTCDAYLELYRTHLGN